MKRYFSVEENADTVHVVSVEVHETKGFSRGQQKRLVVSLDPDTFDEISRAASKRKVSMAEQIRLLIEWGLEAK